MNGGINRRFGIDVVKDDELEFKKVLYPIHDPRGVLFTDEDECQKALESGEYVKSPRDCKPKEEEPIVVEKEEEINWAERIKLRRPDLPPPKKYNMQKYLSQMNVKSLIKEGKKWGLDFSDYYDLPI